MAKPQRKKAPRIRHKDARFTARLTPDEAKMFDAISDQRGITRSAAFRKWIHGASLPSADDRQRRLLLFLTNKVEALSRNLQQNPNPSLESIQLMNRLVVFAADLKTTFGPLSKEDQRRS